MPVINIALQSISTEEKKSLISALTQSAAQATRIPESKFIVLVNELPADAIGIGGLSLAEIKSATPA